MATNILVPSPGDTLSRNGGLVIHYGTALPLGRVLDIVPGGPPRVVSFEQFADGKSVRVRETHGVDVSAVLARAIEIAATQKTYSAISCNCEHVKNFVRSGTRYSETVTITLLSALLAGLYVLWRGRGQ